VYEEGDTEGRSDRLKDTSSVVFLVRVVGVSDELGCCVEKVFSMEERVDGVDEPNK